MRRSPVALALVAVALTAAACGGSGEASSDTSGTDVAASDNGNAAGILSAIDTKASTGPQKLKLELAVDIKGSPTDAQLAVFTKQPIKLGLDGVVDATGKTGDVNVSVTLGDTPIQAEIRYGGSKSWIQIDGKWYDLPADALSSTTGQSLPSGTSVSSLDAGKILAAIGDPSKLLENTSVSSEKVEGIDSDKVSGDVNMAGVANAVANVSKSMGNSDAKPPTQAEIDKVVARLDDVVKKAHVDLWVGKDDHKVHRVAFAVDATMDSATKTSSGIEALALNFDVTTVDAEAPDVSAPSSVGTQAEFQTAVIGLLGKVMGGAASG
jgi:hypothetical protein